MCTFSCVPSNVSANQVQQLTNLQTFWWYLPRWWCRFCTERAFQMCFAQHNVSSLKQETFLGFYTIISYFILFSVHRFLIKWTTTLRDHCCEPHISVQLQPCLRGAPLSELWSLTRIPHSMLTMLCKIDVFCKFGSWTEKLRPGISGTSNLFNPDADSALQGWNHDRFDSLQMLAQFFRGGADLTAERCESMNLNKPYKQ